MAATSKSFKKDGVPPIRYRTPSPPRYAFEPVSPTISPITSEDAGIEALGMRWANDKRSHNELRRPLDTQHDGYDDLRNYKSGARDTMDTFASIALATDPMSSSPINCFPIKLPTGLVVHDSQRQERPSKRARSEKLPSPEWHRVGKKSGIRPATSYQLSDSRTFEAELLLNFSQEARFLTPLPRPSDRQSDTDLSPRPLDTLPNALGEPKPLISEHDSRTHEGTQSRSINIQNGRTELGSDGVVASNAEYPEYTFGTQDAISHLPSSPDKNSTQAKTIEADSFDPVVDSYVPETSSFGSNSRVLHEEPKALEEVLSNAPGHLKDFQPVDDIDRLRDDLHAAVQDHGKVQGNTKQVAMDADNTDYMQAEATLEGIRVESRTERDKSELTVLSVVAGTQMDTFSPVPTSNSTNHVSDVRDVIPTSSVASEAEVPEHKARQPTAPAVCATCHFTRNSLSVENDNNSTSWISCDGCKAWFHFACAGFKSEREVRGVDKYRCRKCKPIHGPTTYVRKSSRARTAIDYAGLHEGVIKTSDETPEHHYIKPIKDGTITFQPESFARMRPELVTAEYFEKGNGMKQPVVIPACLNPQPQGLALSSENTRQDHSDEHARSDLSHAETVLEDCFGQDLEFQRVLDHGQDALDMVIPRNLTVRKIAELYGPEEKVEVIDVKSQNGEGKKWNMRRWADYYESSTNKVVRNVISLEVSQSKLGRLIRRPQIVRDLDLQDSVWPSELQARGEYPRVQFYCLMSVADCFTDFHIDFGGSSVFYHILKGKKTFLFIPPKEKHLKKYEEWCMSPAQNWTFLADQTKECYRVDLTEGDTMLIPAGWIHAVWTPEDSLVIGGNFLTRMHYGMQLRISQIEKATGVARKFRYPHFQKIHWYTALRYLEDDPLPDNVKEVVQEGGIFQREQPAHYDFDEWGENSRSGLGNYHARYYSLAELEGLPDLARYLWRTALIDLGSVTDGITTETRNAVKKSIPRGYGEPLAIVKRFALWCAWKRGEPIPHWAYREAVPDGYAQESATKPSAAAIRKLHLEAALRTPRRQSARRISQQHLSISEAGPILPEDLHASKSIAQPESIAPSNLSNPPAPISEPTTPSKRKHPDNCASEPLDTAMSNLLKRRKIALGTGTGSHRKPACESCRKRRRACKHRDQPELPVSSAQGTNVDNDTGEFIPKKQNNDGPESRQNSDELPKVAETESLWRRQLENQLDKSNPFGNGQLGAVHGNERRPPHLAQSNLPVVEDRTHNATVKGLDGKFKDLPNKGGRSKACNDCRKSKRRCIHDEHGKRDLLKAREAVIPRPAAALKRRKLDGEGQYSSVVKNLGPSDLGFTASGPNTQDSVPRTAVPLNHPYWPVPVANISGEISSPKDQQLQQPNMAAIPSDSTRSTDNVYDNAGVTDYKQIRAQDGAPDKETWPQETPKDSAGNIEDEVQLVAIPPSSGFKAEAGFMHIVPEAEESFEQPAASSLVSPPASSYNDAGHTPPASNTKSTPSSSSSRHSSHPTKRTQRYTPESGSARRASSSSLGETTAEKSSTLMIGSLKTKVVPQAGLGQKQIKTQLSPEIVADGESLRLIKDLQAQEHGLRRRG